MVSLVVRAEPSGKNSRGSDSEQSGRSLWLFKNGCLMDLDDQDNDIAVTLLNNAEDDQLSLEDSNRQSSTGRVGCFAAVLSIVIVVVLAFLLT